MSCGAAGLSQEQENPYLSLDTVPTRRIQRVASRQADGASGRRSPRNAAGGARWEKYEYSWPMTILAS